MTRSIDTEANNIEMILREETTGITPGVVSRWRSERVGAFIWISLEGTEKTDSTGPGQAGFHNYSRFWALRPSLLMWHMALGWLRRTKVGSIEGPKGNRQLEVRALDLMLCIWKLGLLVSPLLSPETDSGCPCKATESSRRSYGNSKIWVLKPGTDITLHILVTFFLSSLCKQPKNKNFQRTILTQYIYVVSIFNMQLIKNY